MFVLLLAACASERGPRAGDEVVEYDGYIFDGPQATEEQLFDAGLVRFHVGDEVLDATQPYDSYPGYWRVEIPRATAFELTIAAEGAWPVRWAGLSPGAPGAWFSGALFGGDPTLVGELLATLAPPGHDTVDPADTSVVHVIGTAWDGESWDCALLTVNGAPATCYAVDPDTGATMVVSEGPVSFFVALHVPAGEVVVDSGVGGVQTYAAEGGEIVYAYWFQGAPS